MLTQNFRRMAVAMAVASPYFPSTINVKGETHTIAGYASKPTMALITDIQSLKYSELVADTSKTGSSTFAFGSGDAAVTKDDICFAVNPTQAPSVDNPSTLIADTDFTLSSATRINANNQGINNKCVLEQTYTYNGTSQITINEIGLMYKDNKVADEAYMTLAAREVLDSPITVNNGDTFTVSMVIG